MGLISAALGAATGVLADQWKEYFYCEALPETVLVTKGKKRVSNRSSNTKGSDNIISNGSVIAVADGQCMIIVDQGKVVELCAEPGEFKYDTSTEPSIFTGSLGTAILETFKQIGKRITFGGEPPKDQRIYYFNTKEIMGNKYGTPSPVPFRVVDQRVNLDVDIGIRCFGEYSYHICNPMLFYANVCGNVTQDYTRDKIDPQLKSELLTALQPAFAKISDMGIRYSGLPAHTEELAQALNDVLSAKWRDRLGIEIVSVGVSSVKASEEDEAMIKQMQTMQTASGMAAQLAGAQAQAMKDAANNPNGAAMGFMGMNAAAGTGGFDPNTLMAAAMVQNAQPAAAAPAADSWTCACGKVNTGKFCTECGAKKPEPPASWTCGCGTVNTGKFCTECGARKPEEPASWTCDCGAVNTGKFCTECGAKKPE